MSPETFGKFETAVRGIPRFVIQTLLAAISGTVLASFLDYLIFEWWSAALGTPRSATPHLIGLVVPACVGAFLAYLWFLPKTLLPNPYVWIIPLIWLLICIREDYIAVLEQPFGIDGLNPARNIWDTYFGVRCRGLECMLQVIATVPFLCSVGYSITGVFIRLKQKVRTSAIISSLSP
jgi:hypothetical protein